MILELSTAAAMYWANTATAADTDIPQMLSPAAVCRYRDPQKLRQCLNAKMQPEPDPMAAMWDPNWISAVTPVPEPGQASGSATTANPNVAKKPLK
jgi:hypothetical protein